MGICPGDRRLIVHPSESIGNLFSLQVLILES